MRQCNELRVAGNSGSARQSRDEFKAIERPAVAALQRYDPASGAPLFGGRRADWRMALQP